MELTQRRLNRALLARQLLLERRRTPLVRAVERIGGPRRSTRRRAYIGLWSRLRRLRACRPDTFALEQGLGVVQATLLRGTIHIVSRADYWPFAEAIRRDRREQRLRGHARVLGGLDLSPRDQGRP